MDYLEACLTLENYKDHIAWIESVLYCKDWSLKSRLAQLLVCFPNEHAKKMLLQLLRDSNELVQVEALDSLASFPSEETFDAVITHLTSRHPLVRSYTYLCIGEICPKEKREEVLLSLQEITEKNTNSKIGLLFCLVQLGERDKINDLLKMISRCNYRNKIAILNSFEYYWDDYTKEEKDNIYQAIKKRDFSKEGRAVRTALEQFFLLKIE